MMIFFLAVLLSLVCGQLAEANHTALHTAASALSAGQWSNGPITGMGNIQGTADAFDHNPVIAAPGPGFDGAQPGWNSHNQKIYISTTEHGFTASCPGNWPAFSFVCYKQMWVYDDATSNWTVGIPPTITMPFMNDGGNPVAGFHHYYEVAWDDDNQILYGREYYTGRFYRFCVNNTPTVPCSGKANTWSKLQQDNPYYRNCCNQMAYHAALQKLIYFDGSDQTGTCGIFSAWSEATGTWSQIGNAAGCAYPVPPIGGANESRNMLGGYSHVKQIAVFGGGTGSGSNSKFYGVNAAGAVVSLDPVPSTCPGGMGSTTGPGGDMYNAFAEDPTSGDFIAVGCGTTGKVHRLNPTASLGSQWTLIDSNLNTTGKICNQNRNAANGCSFDFWPVPISTYGVIGYWKYRTGNTAEFWLYKPSTTSGDTSPPTGVAVTAPTGGATVSGASVTLTATASDNIGVAGVQFKVDGSNVSVEDTTSPFSITWDSTTVSNATHTITATARDAAGNTTTSSGISVTVSNAGGGGADFATRCAASGVFFCNGFDSTGDLGSQGWGNARGYGSADGSPCKGNNCPTIDTTTKVSGAGSLKFFIPPGGSGADAGSYWANPSTDLSVRFGAGQTWYVQFRQRVTASYTDAAANNNKIHWVSSRPDLPGCNPSTANGTSGLCFATCTENEVVNQNQYSNPSNAFPRWYTACPDPINNFEFIEPITPGQYNLENGRTAPGCIYDNVIAGNIFPPKGNCFPFSFDQWVTWSYKITLGSIGTGTAGGLCYDASNPSIPTNKGNCYYGGQFLARAGVDGQPLTTVLNWTGPMIAKYNTDPTELRYGKVFFAPYTGSGSVLPSGATMWFDELIMSLNPIPDPGAGGGTVAAPTTIRLSGGY